MKATNDGQNSLAWTIRNASLQDSEGHLVSFEHHVELRIMEE